MHTTMNKNMIDREQEEMFHPHKLVIRYRSKGVILVEEKEF